MTKALEASPSNLFVSPTLTNDVRQALKQWHGDAHAESPLHHLYLFRTFRQQISGNSRRVTNEVLSSALETLKQSHREDANFLQRRFLDLWPINRLANRLNVAESTVYTLQKQAIERLAAVLQNMEEEASAEHKAFLIERLEPATYSRLIGVEAQIETLQKVLLPQEPPWLIILEGIGGIGKTSLADALLRHIIQQGLYDEVGWVTARQSRLNLGGMLNTVGQLPLTSENLMEKLANQLLPKTAAPKHYSIEQLLHALQARIKAVPHLIVIDNLETLTDVAGLLPTLQALSNPSKFILTSRESLRIEPNIFHLTIPELSWEDSLRLVRQEATYSNLPLLAACSDDELAPLYHVVGGNPLALRLVTGQTHVYTLESILQDLSAARGETVENLYTFIYRRSWEKLDSLAKQVFLVMSLTQPGGESIEYLAQVSALEIGEVRMAINRLVLQNLVDARGGMKERRYSIHSLTRTFLLEQVAKWQR